MLMTESAVKSLNLPAEIQETDSFKPLSHREALEHVEDVLNQRGIEIARDDEGEQTKRFVLTNDKAKMVCSMPLSMRINPEARMMIAIINSWDKTSALRVGFGSEVFVCTNGCIFASQVVGRKHTPNILEDLPNRMSDAIGKLEEYRTQQRDFFGRLQEIELTDKDAYHLVGRAAREHECVTGGEIIHVLNEWHKPRYEEFAPRNAWSLMNAFTEVSKRIANKNGIKFAERTQQLSGLFADTFAKDLNLRASLKSLDSDNTPAIMN